MYVFSSNFTEKLKINSSKKSMKSQFNHFTCWLNNVECQKNCLLKFSK